MIGSWQLRRGAPLASYTPRQGSIFDVARDTTSGAAEDAMLAAILAQREAAAGRGRPYQLGPSDAFATYDPGPSAGRTQPVRAAGIGSSAAQPRPRLNTAALMESLPPTEDPIMPSTRPLHDFRAEPSSLAMAAKASPELPPAREPDPRQLAEDIGPLPQERRGGILGRIGDFLASDEGRAALLRSGAATLSGGLGAGVQAGAEFINQRRREAESARRYDLDQALRERGIVVDEFNANAMDEVRRAGLMLDEAKLEEMSRGNRVDEAIRARQILQQWLQHVTPSGSTRLSQESANWRHGVPSADTRLREESADRRHGTPSGNTVYSQGQQNDRAAADRAARYGPSRRVDEEYAPDGSLVGRTVRSEGPPQPGFLQELVGSIGSPFAAAAATPEVRYDEAGMAYVQGPGGTAVRAPQYDRR